MKKQKSILLPVAFLTQTLLLIWRLEEFYELDDYAAALCSDLSELIEKKFEAINRRAVFSDYITAPPGSPEREAFRDEYLGMTSIHKNWRSGSEVLDYPPF